MRWTRQLLAGLAAGTVAPDLVAAPPTYRAVIVDVRAPMDVGLEQQGLDIEAGWLVGSIHPEAGVYRRGFVVHADGSGGILHPVRGFEQSSAAAVNASGLIVGESTKHDGHYVIGRRATAWRGVEPVALGTFGGPHSGARDVNALGQAVGFSEAADGALLPCVWLGDMPAALLLPPGVDGGIAESITDSGYIAGFVLEDGAARAVRWSPDGTPEVLDIDVEHIWSTQAMDINELGHALILVVQDYPVATWAGIWSGEAFDPVPLEEFWPTAINGHDAIIGVSSGGLGAVYADHDGVFPLRDQIVEGPTEIERAEDIDDSGRIAGAARVDGRLHAVVLEPIGR